jgi:hypothetical protein
LKERELLRQVILMEAQDTSVLNLPLAIKDFEILINGFIPALSYLPNFLRKKANIER